LLNPLADLFLPDAAHARTARELDRLFVHRRGFAYGLVVGACLGALVGVALGAA
jgi:hypothetical protein